MEGEVCGGVVAGQAIHLYFFVLSASVDRSRLGRQRASELLRRPATDIDLFEGTRRRPSVVSRSVEADLEALADLVDAAVSRSVDDRLRTVCCRELLTGDGRDDFVDASDVLDHGCQLVLGFP